jgi:acyl-CoA reductase-like NAD-dependent aldehyde dehydrogenase
VFRVSIIDEAISLANVTSFGLGAAAWTNDTAEQLRFIDELEAGSVFINGMVASIRVCLLVALSIPGMARAIRVWYQRVR